MCDYEVTVYCPKCKKYAQVEPPEGCYCDEDQGAGYSYIDEHAECDVCLDTSFECPECNGVITIEKEVCYELE